ncbi:hypothetical protein PPL_05319 [Heterostelium album PN500]|uniref:Uncharacterized protein n=1 Tax=Heterostelium pallidum (strain ATCC 26659 / Pp 5 / PN500) TaxID=670386 RepID=D3BBC9_HETP5|nr:hypothetical protein PPL_05319 [Heterostelium album PN500]EFA81336.1 hypothetical protein PPL_05319 [Heterostelium album PN500]|eukprot:XP_020433454.1 hypothetical protein PPL_05319 [Heterostelium album PN500]
MTIFYCINTLIYRMNKLGYTPMRVLSNELHYHHQTTTIILFTTPQRTEKDIYFSYEDDKECQRCHRFADFCKNAYLNSMNNINIDLLQQ